MASPPRKTPTPRREKQIAPGIYFTPAPSTTKPRTVPETRPLSEMSLSELQAERDALLQSVAMLRSSNVQIDAFDPAGEDPDLRQALLENRDIIAAREARAETIAQAIASMPSTCAAKSDNGMFL